MTVWQAKLQEVLESWRGTPWVAGCGLRGRGVDCVRFVVAVLDELHQQSPGPVPRLPQDMSIHDRMVAFSSAHLIAQRYPHEIIESQPGLIQSGDVVVFRMGIAGGPGHVAIAGGRDARELWHSAAGVGVCRTSAAASGHILRIWRPTQREDWA